jgi:hypothetical protein
LLNITFNWRVVTSETGSADVTVNSSFVGGSYQTKIFEGEIFRRKMQGTFNNFYTMSKTFSVQPGAGYAVL